MPDPSFFEEYLTPAGRFPHMWWELSNFLFSVWPSEYMGRDSFMNADNGFAVAEGRNEASFHWRDQPCFHPNYVTRHKVNADTIWTENGRHHNHAFSKIVCTKINGLRVNGPDETRRQVARYT
ncbi:hypothetical protein BQ8482_160116 [Mesorhizobium delmotii]|uniref:Uncharacterized protein n=1 Tax=Mesorhizobium delmotii TaxID=1631247 RepID=A0A2P9AHN5_9HYPH|nr:hypothetical protein BQ8482_160116 [Mesorhizobium delmotii]